MLGVEAYEHNKVTKLLLEAGADPNIKDNYGDTAFGQSYSEKQIRNYIFARMISKSFTEHLL